MAADDDDAAAAALRLLRAEAPALVAAVATGATPRDRRRALAVALPVVLRGLDPPRRWALAAALPLLAHCLARAAAARDWGEAAGLAALAAGILDDVAPPRVAEVLRRHYLPVVGRALAVLRRSPEVAAAAVAAVGRLLGRVAAVRLPVVCLDGKEQVVRLLQGVIRDHRVKRPLLTTSAVRLLGGLAHHDESRVYLMRYPGLVDDVLAVHVAAAQEEIACLLSNLSSETRNRAAMIQNKRMLPRLVELATSGSIKTRQHVMRTWRRIYLSASNKKTLVENAEALHFLLDATQQKMLQSEALSTILFLIGPTTTRKIISVPFLACLKSVAQPDEDLTEQAHHLAEAAARCFEKLAANISVSDACYNDFLDCLASLALSQRTEVRKWVALALLEQTRQLSNAFFIVRDSEMMSIIRCLADDTMSEVKATATEALMRLASTDANVRRVMHDDEVLTAIIDNTNDWCEHTSRRAVRAILNLVDYTPLRSRAAKELDLVACLSTYGVSDDNDDELKREALRRVVLLAPLL